MSIGLTIVTIQIIGAYHVTARITGNASETTLGQPKGSETGRPYG